MKKSYYKSPIGVLEIICERWGFGLNSIRDILKKSFLDGYSSTEITTMTVITAIAISCLLALYIFSVYRILTRKTFYNKNFNITLAGVCVITSAVVLTIQSSVVVSLGMVGALSIVRFRTAIKEPLDIAFLFWSIAVGIVLAAGMIPLAVIGSVIIGVILLIFVNRKAHKNPYIVVVRCDGHDAEEKAKKFLDEKAERCVVKSKSAQKGAVELNMEIRLKDDNTDFVNALADMVGVQSAVLVSYNGDYMG